MAAWRATKQRWGWATTRGDGKASWATLCVPLPRVPLLREGQQDAASLPGAGGAEQSAVKCPSWMLWMGSPGDVSTSLALPQLHRADHLIAQKAAEKGAEPWPCRPSPLSAEALGGLSRQGPGAQNRSGRHTQSRHPCRSHGHLSPALHPATHSGPEPKTSPPQLPYQSHGAEEDPGEGGQLVQDPQVLQLGLGSGDLSKDTAGDITTGGTPAVSPRRHRGGAGRAAGLTLVPPGWFWWALSCCERDLRRLFSLTSCSSEGGRKGSRPHSFLREGAASDGAPQGLGTAAGEPYLGSVGTSVGTGGQREPARCRRASSSREREPELQLGVTAAGTALAWVPWGWGARR